LRRRPGPHGPSEAPRSGARQPRRSATSAGCERSPHATPEPKRRGRTGRGRTVTHRRPPGPAPGSPSNSPLAGHGMSKPALPHECVYPGSPYGRSGAGGLEPPAGLAILSRRATDESSGGRTQKAAGARAKHRDSRRPRRGVLKGTAGRGRSRPDCHDRGAQRGQGKRRIWWRRPVVAARRGFLAAIRA
jgi:hypothetical protein